jgi:hypothetical protein
MPSESGLAGPLGHEDNAYDDTIISSRETPNPSEISNRFYDMSSSRIAIQPASFHRSVNSKGNGFLALQLTNPSGPPNASVEMGKSRWENSVCRITH